MALDRLLNSTKLPLGQTEVLGKFDPGLNPEFRFSLRRLDKDVDSGLFARKEKAAKRPLTEDGWAHPDRAPNDPASAAARQRRAVRCKPMLCTRAQARLDDFRISSTVDAREEDDLIAGHTEPERVLEAAEKDASVPAVEVRIREGIADSSSNRFIDRPAEFGGEPGTPSFQPILDRFEVAFRRSADNGVERQRLRFSSRALTSDHAL